MFWHPRRAAIAWNSLGYCSRNPSSRHMLHLCAPGFHAQDRVDDVRDRHASRLRSRDVQVERPEAKLTARQKQQSLPLTKRLQRNRTVLHHMWFQIDEILLLTTMDCAWPHDSRPRDEVPRSEAQVTHRVNSNQGGRSAEPRATMYSKSAVHRLNFLQKRVDEIHRGTTAILKGKPQVPHSSTLKSIRVVDKHTAPLPLLLPLWAVALHNELDVVLQHVRHEGLRSTSGQSVLILFLAPRACHCESLARKQPTHVTPRSMQHRQVLFDIVSEVVQPSHVRGILKAREDLKNADAELVTVVFPDLSSRTSAPTI
mmetsp:Transcript_37842/g.100725  ORF Transcript_37842/g.100725 Transcript_37842/m.100725 type:complete len:313 (-) Transcript_37842:40-978(-)